MNKLRDLIKINLSTEEQAAIASFKPAVVDVTPITVKAAEVKTKDGAITLSYEGDTLAIGTPVMDITSGTSVPAADGEYTLADDSVITVVSGTVTEIETAKAADVEVTAPPAAQQMTAEMATKMESHKAELDKLKSENALMATQLSALNKTIEAMLDTAIVSGKIGDNVPEKAPKAYAEMTNHEKALYNRGLI